jgi:hypothetical protein
VLKEACHVFRRHAERVWKSHDKDACARLITEDRVIRMLTHRAIERNKDTR